MMPSYELVPEDLEGERALYELDSLQQLPQISVDDPAVLSLRGELEMSKDDIEGRVVKFLRRSVKAGISPYYRIIVASPIASETMKMSWGKYYYGWTL